MTKKRVFEITFLTGCIIFLIAAIFSRKTLAKAENITQGITTNMPHISIEDNFADDSVIVIMDKETGGINKKFSTDFFGDFPKKRVTDLTAVKNNIRELESLDVDNFTQIFEIELDVHSKENVIDIINEISQVNGIAWVGPNYYDRPAVLPNCAMGTRYKYLWGLHGENGIYAEEAWKLSIGSEEVRVGVIDSGIASHSDLNNVVSGWDFYNDDSITDDDVSGHGTHVSGIIAASGINVNGVVGVARNIQLVPLQVDNLSGNWSISAVTKAVTWAINNDIDILNYSGGGNTDDTARKAAFNNFKGVVVCAAGNGGGDGIGDNNDEQSFYPANYSIGQAFSDRLISVGAINRSSNRSVFSNYGMSTVSLFAPGEDIYSTYPGNTYRSLSGTSMAAPHVTGVAALMLSINPDLSAEELKTAILNNVDIPDEGGINPLEGLCVTNGRLNAYKAVSSVALQMNGGRIVGLDDEAAADLKYVTVPELFDGTPVVEIGDYAFANYSCLERIEIPDGIAVSKTAFEGCLQLENIVKKSYLVHDTGDLSTTFTDWVTLESLYTIDEKLLYNMGKRKLSITYTADFEVYKTVEYELRLCQNGEELSKASFKPDSGENHTRIHTFDSVLLSDSSETMRLDIQIRYRKTNWLWGGDFTVTGDRTEIDLIQGENVDIQEGMVIENGKLSAFYQPVGFDGELEIPYGVTEIEEYVFNKGGADSFDLIKITIPNSVTKIDDGAFQSCMDLETVKFAANSNLREIGANAFYECIHLQDIIFPETLEAIGERAFMFCSALQEIEIPENITEIGSEAFFECNNISVINYNAINCTSFGTGREVFQDFFNVSSDLEVYIGENVTVLPEKLFSGMRKIHSIIIPDSVTLIKDDAFNGCHSLNSIILSNSVTSIGEDAFNCGNLQNVYYSGTSLAEWKNINIADGNTALINAKRYYYSDLQPTIPGNYWHFDGTESVVWTPVISWNGATANGADGTSTTTQITLTFSQDPGEDFSVDNIILEGAIKGELQGTGETRVLTISDISVNNGDSVNISIISPEGYILTGSPKEITVFLETHNIIYKDVGGESFSGLHEPGYPTQHIGGRTTYLDYPTKVNHVFEGWYLEEDGSGSSMTYLSETGYIGNITLYAKWVNIEGFEFNLIDDGTAYEISQSTAILNSKLVIPSTYNGLPVVKIADSGFSNSQISEVVIPDSIITIGEKAFKWSKVEIVTFESENSLENIGSESFAYCYNLNDIIIPASTKIIDTKAFYQSTLESITFAANSALESIGSLAFSKCDLLSINIPVNVRTIGDEAFLAADALTSVTFEENSALENIGEDAFRGCEQLTGIVIPENVETIGSGAFFGTGLSSVTFSENGSLEDIGSSAFYGCNLIEVSIPESVIHIGDSAFSGNGSLSTVNIPTGSMLESIGKAAFKGCNIESIHIPGNVISIGADAFRSNFNLEEIVFASNAAMTTIGNYAFADCDKLTSFYLPANVSDAGNAIVYGNSLIQLSVDSQNLTYTAEGNCIIRKSDNVLLLGCRASIIPQYVTSIADYAFFECQELTNITIPDTVTSIGEYAFAESGITTITLPNVTVIGEWAFSNSALEQISFSNTLVEIDKYAFGYCENLESVIFPEGLIRIGLSAFYSCDSLVSISIPASVDSIGDGAFSFCLNLESITIDKANVAYSDDGNCIIQKSDNTLLFGCKTSTIPNYVQKIGKEAFYRSEILSLDIPYGVTEIGEQAFWYSSITHVTLPNSITIIRAKAFEGCNSLTELIIPESVTTIGDEAFYSCSGLTEITVPANVVSMGESVFGSWNEDQVIYVEAPASMLEVWNTKWLADCYARIEWEAAEDYFTPGLEFIDVDGISYVVAAGTSLSGGRETVVIPATYEGYPVVGVADYGFYACEVTNIVFVPNDEFVSIGEYAFAESGLKSINLPNAIEYIGQYAFARCYDLAITLPDTMGWLDVDDTWFDEASGITVYTEYYRWDIDEKFVDLLAGSGCIVWECVLSEEDSHVIAIVHSEDNIYDYDLVNPYRKGYEFIGWSTVPDSTEAEYTSEDLINWNVPMEEDSVILYAVWVAVED